MNEEILNIIFLNIQKYITITHNSRVALPAKTCHIRIQKKQERNYLFVRQLCATVLNNFPS